MVESTKSQLRMFESGFRAEYPLSGTEAQPHHFRPTTRQLIAVF